MLFKVAILLMLISHVQNVELCGCDNKAKNRYMFGEVVPEDLCTASTLIEVRVKDVKDGPEGMLEYKIDLKGVHRGNLNGVSHLSSVFTPLADPSCNDDIIMEIGQEYILSVVKDGGFLTSEICSYASDIRYMTEAQRQIIKNGACWG